MTVTVLPGPERRRRWTTVEKLRIVEESETAAMPIVEVAHRHGIHPNQLHGWRRQARLGLGTQECRLVPIAVAPAESKVCEQPKAAVGDDRRSSNWCCATDEFCACQRVWRRHEPPRSLRRWRVAGKMIAFPSGVQVSLATGHTDMRKGFDGLAVLVQEVLKRDPHKGHLFVFRGRLIDWQLLSSEPLRPAPNKSACGHGGTRCACKMECTSFLIRVGCRTT